MYALKLRERKKPRASLLRLESSQDYMLLGRTILRMGSNFATLGLNAVLCSYAAFLHSTNSENLLNSAFRRESNNYSNYQILHT